MKSSWDSETSFFGPTSEVGAKAVSALCSPLLDDSPLLRRLVNSLSFLIVVLLQSLAQDILHRSSSYMAPYQWKATDSAICEISEYQDHLMVYGRTLRTLVGVMATRQPQQRSVKFLFDSNTCSLA